ncbi:MAG: hypothetical protein ABS46_05585 [Cytophagaceae bacterium SCN 52-12]|nr:MAG: hypothetical protein ABS46_05585 [Cytophagaceae bacterium SCN 52-12]
MSAIKLLPVVFLLVLTGCGERKPVFESPLLKNIGDYSVPVTTSSKYARQFFNQGLIMANAFNHGEAERSFREAVRLDTAFAMGYWGIAYVLGPNLNSADNLGAASEIHRAVSRAGHFSGSASAWEKALIDAFMVRFPADSAAADDEGFARSMKLAYEQFPGHTLLTTLYAECLMNRHAWDFFDGKGGQARPWTPGILSLLEEALAAEPENPLANHLYLHATESGSDFTKALECAERLKKLVPSAGHLVHMPSHIYINTGDYHEGSLANEDAVKADSAYIAECRVQGYYPQMYYTHNYHFLAATAAFEGRAARSIEAAFKTAGLVESRYYHEPGFETVQHYLTIPDHILVKFAQWEKILALPAPAADLLYPGAIRHYARGMAYANTGKPEAAGKELEQLNELAGSPLLEGQMIWGINHVSEVCRIAALVLQAEILAAAGRPQQALPLLADAVRIEDRLNYTEPPDWFFSVRHALGALLLQAGDAPQAEKVYREDLARWPRNGFALNGLAESLAAQARTAEAEAVRAQFAEAWQYADTELTASRVDPAKRKNLTLKIDASSPAGLIALSGAMCAGR